MTLGHLKKSLTRFPTDLDDSEIIIMTKDNELKYDLLAFVAYAELGENSQTAVILGSVDAAKEYKNTGHFRYPDGSVPPDEHFITGEE